MDPELLTTAGVQLRSHRLAVFSCLLLALLWAGSPGLCLATTWHVPGDVPTLQAAIDSAGTGDDILVSPGVYQEHDVLMKGGIILHSSGGASVTTVDAMQLGSVFICSNLQEAAVIDGFTIVNGSAESGGGLYASNANVTLRGCVITQCAASNRGGGVYATEGGDIAIARSVITGCRGGEGGGIGVFEASCSITDCEVSNNRAMAGEGGIGAGWGPRVSIVRCSIVGNTTYSGEAGGIACAAPMVTIRDCLIARNDAWDYADASGLLLEMSTGVVEGCTLADNGGYASVSAIVTGWSHIDFSNIIIAFNTGRAFSQVADSDVTLRCSDIYGNDVDNTYGTDLGGNFSTDPLFCNHDDYTLDGQSPCLPGWEHGGVDCGLIGARGQGCGTAPTGACCFFDGSCTVLGEQQCTDQHGTYQGNGSTCDPNPCHPSPTRPTTWGRIKAGFR